MKSEMRDLIKEMSKEISVKTEESQANACIRHWPHDSVEMNGSAVLCKVCR